MTKLTKQNVAGTDYAMVGCTLTGVSATSADTFLKVISLSDGDIVADGMTVVCTFANGNTAGNAPNSITIYSSDQVHYYSDSGLTQAFTLAPEGCYEITYTGTGNAYEYISYPVFQIGDVTGPLCDTKGHPVGGELWEAGDVVMSTYSGGKFLMASSAAKISEAAERLETARNLKVALGSSNAQSFDGSADATSIGVSGTLPVANGGTGQTTAKGAEYSIIGGVEQVTTDFDDNRYIAVQNQTVSASNGTFRWFKVSNLWEYIKGKIQSIALTIGSTTSAIAETLYGSLTVKNSSGTTTASIAQDGKITGNALTASSMCKAVTCSTASATSAKTVTLAGFTLVKGARLLITMSNANTVASELTLNVNSTGAKTIRWNGSVTSSSYYAMTATTYNCYYDGTYWIMDSGYEAYSARTAGSCSGNSSTADTTRGTAYCTTAGGTQAKVASMRGFVLTRGATFPITFTSANSYNGTITLNVNSTGAKNIYINNAVSSSSNKTLPAGTYLCRYDGSYYYIDIEYAVTNARNANYASSAGSATSATTATTATTANKIRTSAPSSPANGDIWLE